MTSDERWKARGWRRLNHFFVSEFREARDFGATISLTCVSDRQSVFVNPLDPLQARKWCHCRFSGQIVHFYWNWIVQDRRSDWRRLFRLEFVSKKPKLTGATNYTPNEEILLILVSSLENVGCDVTWQWYHFKQSRFLAFVFENSYRVTNCVFIQDRTVVNDEILNDWFN